MLHINLSKIDHPVIHDKMTRLRNSNTNTKEFREIVSELSTLIAYEALRDVGLKNEFTRTPVGETMGSKLRDEYAIVPILRAGLGMVDGVLNVLPTAKVGHLGMYRDPVSLQPVDYYNKLPKDIQERNVLLLDPMLATGGTASMAISMLKSIGVSNIKFLCICSCNPGVDRLRVEHPDIGIWAATHDNVLNPNGYIIPGLGDAGDRIFGTK